MGKYVITESQLKKVVYGILNPRVVGLYVEDLSRYPYYHYKVKEVDTHGGSLRVYTTKNKNKRLHKSVNKYIKIEKKSVHILNADYK